MATEHVTDLIAAYTLGALEPDEVDLVERHLEVCGQCRAAARAAQHIADELLVLLAQPTTQAPPSLRERTLARVRAAAQADALASSTTTPHEPHEPVGVTANLQENAFQRFLRNLLGAPAPTAPTTQQEAELLLDLLADPECVIWPVGGTDDAPHASGRLIGSRSRRQAALVTVGLHPLAQNQEYQVWFLQGGKPQPNSLFRVNHAGQAVSIVRASAPLGAFDTVAVTPEPAGGSPGPTGPIVLAGKLDGVD